ncbi:L,D-transpeptidase [Kaistella polysaccharea]|uniref:L,D-transpeptidase n=1 Tax=Kaistella polysaccharea TaxID=2878534 RepID=UPI001CF44CA3|nr:L,D-transpeptidase [Kaistella polysaccharea]
MPNISSKTFFTSFFFILLLSVTWQCKKDEAPTPEGKGINSDSLKAAEKAARIKDSLEKNKITYTTFLFPQKKKDSAMNVFTEKFSKDEQYIILALNRLDTKNKWRADTLSIPDKFDKSLMIYSPFPGTLDILKKVDKIVLFSYPIQAYALYEYGKLLKWGPTSLGKKTAQTKRGLMFANWKKELAISTVDSDWKLPYNFNIHNTLGIGWHEYDLPGYPASHSCLRLLREDAKYLYEWADQWTLTKGGAAVKTNGTPVIVFGDYNWGGKKPWKYLEADSKSNNISAEALNEIIELHLEKIMTEQQKREDLKATQETSASGI